MPWRSILSRLLQDERVIEKVADNRVIRRAAQLTAYFMHRGPERFQSFKKTFEKEVKEGLEEVKRKHGR